MKNVLLTLLSCLLLLAFAAAVPSPVITQAAQDSYLEQAPSEDDEYAFLFDD